ncbi:MAG: hypothetical protein ACYC9M_12720 [Desulfobulbaceae bacterium]
MPASTRASSEQNTINPDNFLLPMIAEFPFGYLFWSLLSYFLMGLPQGVSLAKLYEPETQRVLFFLCGERTFFLEEERSDEYRLDMINIADQQGKAGPLQELGGVPGSGTTEIITSGSRHQG